MAFHLSKENEVSGKLRRKTQRMTEEAIAKHLQLREGLDRQRIQWHALQPGAPELEPPDLHTAAVVVVIDRVRKISDQRAVWPQAQTRFVPPCWWVIERERPSRRSVG